MTAVLPDVHPLWCDPGRCDADDPNLPADGGAHRSAVVAADVEVFFEHRPVRVAGSYLIRRNEHLNSDTRLVLQTTAGQVSIPILKAGGLLMLLSSLTNDLT